MTWTFRRMVGALAIAALLGVAAFAVHAIGAQQRRQVVDHGVRTPARVIATHDSRWADSTEITYRRNGRTDVARLYGQWNGKLEIGTNITVHHDPADPSRLATADGYATDVSTMWPMPLSVIAGWVALAAVTSWLGAVRRRRWETITVDPEPTPDAVSRRRRGVVRRVDVWTRAVFGVLAATMAAILWLAVWDRHLALGMGMLASCMAMMYLVGMAGKIVVTPQSLAVFQTFRVQRVPRRLVESVRLASDGVLELSARDAPVIHVATGAASLWGDELSRRPAQLRAANRLRRLLVEVPPSDVEPTAATSPRYLTIALAVLALAGLVLPLWFI